ncbi:hypothetical protein DHD32_12500 [Arenibacter sp. TNZ]|jgi:uncharacterized membrane protein|uniref:DUF2231 domain-containing protein n=1 Tax=Arenibacter TaxID=178469 RepID=UPI000CD4549A|nr:MULTISPECIES: DUF2231 domain-containing protein [Arenibacter]MCM4172306.1 hypothetical protein [Arenibacter sp. TNZ]
MDIELFLGRFHPLVVHLPIGFIVLAVIIESIGLFKNDKQIYNRIVQYALIAVIVSSLITIATGLLLSQGGEYNVETLNQHKWLGIGVAVFSALILVLKIKIRKYNRKQSIIVSSIFIILVGLTGHQGGVLTHGEEYLLTYAPDAIKNMAGFEIESSKKGIQQKNQDSIVIYRDVIEPMLEQKCTSCHNNDKQKGDLNLMGYKDLFAKAESGYPIVQSVLEESELFKRISLPLNNKKFMPPKGKPLSYSEIKILEYWINIGADSLAVFDHVNMTPELLQLMIRDYSLDFNPKPYIETIVVEDVEQQKVDVLIENGFSVNRLGEDNFLLDVSYDGVAIGEEQISLLKQIGDNITFLNLSNCGLTDEMMGKLPELNNLTKIDLHSNSITDNAIEQLQKYRHLEVINLYDTEISGKGLKLLLDIDSLRRLYLWKTNVTQQMVEDSSNSTNVLIDLGGAI